MSDALDLVKAILAGGHDDDATARDVIEQALRLEVDILLYCATTLGMDATTVMRRAARWAGYGFFDRVPRGLTGSLEPTRLEALAGVRMFRVHLLDREIAFAAPDFLGLIRLKHRLFVTPRLSHQLCLVPETALRDYLITIAAPALIDGARQNLARHWPYASAQLELTAWARYGFAAALALMLSVVLIAPFFAQLLLLPFVLVILVFPAALRLAAVLEPLPPPPVLRRPPDEELPVYSILIPLRSEAAMVPQLFESMLALDYPAARLDIKFVVEARSTTTIAAVEQRLGDPRFSLVPVPDAAPRTKPKALDFALPLCCGQYVVVFDAEDIPDPDQL